MDYNAFGGLQGGTGWYYGFTGREYDHDTGLNYHRARWLDPQIGRWISEDPIGFLGGDGNLNRYVENQTTTYADYEGQQKRIPSLFEQWGGESNGPTAKQLVTKPGPGRDDSYRAAKFQLQLERDITVGIPNAAACLGETAIEGLRYVPGGNTGVELGKLLAGEGSLKDFGTAFVADLLYADEAQRLLQPGIAHPKLRFADETARSFDTFDQLKRALGSPGEGKVWHHIVEQRTPNVQRFGARAIHCKGNVIAVSREVNQRIADYFSSKRSFTGGKTVREWLNSKSFAEQRRIGHKVLDMVLTGQPLP
jgi:RHS repeat-associated protein